MLCIWNQILVLISNHILSLTMSNILNRDEINRNKQKCLAQTRPWRGKLEIWNCYWKHMQGLIRSWKITNRGFRRNQARSELWIYEIISTSEPGWAVEPTRDTVHRLFKWWRSKNKCIIITKTKKQATHLVLIRRYRSCKNSGNAFISAHLQTNNLYDHS